jgi:hypothetical protein
MLLRNFRSAVELGHPNIALMSAITLDQQLTGGCKLPDAWAAADAAEKEQDS